MRRRYIAIRDKGPCLHQPARGRAELHFPRTRAHGVGSFKTRGFESQPSVRKAQGMMEWDIAAHSCSLNAEKSHRPLVGAEWLYLGTKVLGVGSFKTLEFESQPSTWESEETVELGKKKKGPFTPTQHCEDCLKRVVWEPGLGKRLQCCHFPPHHK